MCAAPAGLLIETLLITSDAIPTNVMQSIVVADRFHHVRGLTIAAFAAIKLVMFSRYHGSLLQIVSCREGSGSEDTLP